MLMSDKPTWQTSHYLALLIGWAVLSITLLPGVNIGGFWWTDESRHAMDGVFFLDFFKDIPSTDPVGYAEEYFARYPALGLNWYPPFFAVVEAGMFSLFGISETVARLTVFLFGVLGIAAWVAWMRHFWDGYILAAASTLFLSNLAFVTWSQPVMLELPALSLLLMSFWSYDAYLRNPSAFRSLLTGCLMGATVLTKQASLFAFPLFLIYPLLIGGYRPLFRPAAIWAYSIVALSIAFVVIHALKFSTYGLPFVGGGAEQGKVRDLAYILRGISNSLWATAKAFDYPVLALAAIGAIGGLFSRWRGIILILIVWIGLAMLAFGQVANFRANLIRYSIYYAPAMYLLAAAPLAWLLSQSLPLRIWQGLMALVLGWQCYLLYASNLPTYVNGYEQAAEFISEQPNSQPVLFCCKHDGNFTFNKRANNPERDDVILRADKTLVSISSNAFYGVAQHARSDEEIIEALNDYGVRTLVLENRDMVGIPQFKRLIELAKNPELFEELTQIEIDTNVPEYKDTKVTIYRYLQAREAKDNVLIVPMPHLKREIRLDINP